MIKKILLACSLIVVMSSEAQIPMWTIHPEYSSIRLLGNGYYVVSQNDKYGMLDAKENVVVPLDYDVISPFQSSTALLYKGNRFVAFVSDRGQIHKVSDEDYVPLDACLFTCGYLPVKNKNGCFFLDCSNGTRLGPFTDVTPFSEGYANVRVPKSLKHIFDGSSTLMCISAENGQRVPMSFEDSDDDDIDFISTASNGKSIVVIKKRVFEYDYKAKTLTPLAMDSIGGKKSRVFTLSRPVEPIEGEEDYTIDLKQGAMMFDKQMRLKSIQYFGQPLKTFDIPEEPKVEHTSKYKCYSYEGTDLLSLEYDGQPLLPPQFEQVGELWDKDALVKVNGKWGVVSVDANNACRYVLNDNLDIGFDHKAVKTNVKVVCPPQMSLSLMSLSSFDDNCVINTDTRKETANVESVVLGYECTLSIPDDIGLDRAAASVTVGLNYDGLKFVPQEIAFNTWYINNYSVELTKHQMTNGMLDVDIQVRNSAAGAQAFFKEVAIEGLDSVHASITKITEERYNASLYGWRSDKVRFNIDITEDGCPTLTYLQSIDVRTNSPKSEKKAAEEQETPAVQVKVKRSTKKVTIPKKKEERKGIEL